MKFPIIITIICIIAWSCRQKPVKREPTVLPGKKVDVSSIYKKRSGDLVEALYDELVSGSAELTQLELAIKDLKKQTPDSLKGYKTFNQHNNVFYDLAGKKVNTMTDSVLRKKMLLLINHSRKQYTDSIARLKELDSLINRRTNTLNDLHTILKLVKTLPLIEDFQKTNRPPSLPAEGALQNLDTLINRIDSLVKADSLISKLANVKM
jgi:hypothetical protein